jgi:flagellar basal-body rod protein FlgG
VVINPDGTVMVSQANTTNLQQVGQMQITNFNDPEGLLKRGENLYSVTDASGQANPGPPGQNGLGTIQQNSLEASNVEPVQELIDLITTQRSFELNSQAVKAGDEVLQLISNLRR